MWIYFFNYKFYETHRELTFYSSSISIEKLASKLRCVVNVKYTLDFGGKSAKYLTGNFLYCLHVEMIIFGYIRLNKIYC